MTVAPATLPERWLPALGALAALQDCEYTGYVEASTEYGYHYATLKALAARGYVTLHKRVQASLHCPHVVFWTAEATAAGLAAYAAHKAQT